MNDQPPSPSSASYPLGLRTSDAELRWPLSRGLHPLEVRVLGSLHQRGRRLDEYTASAFHLRKKLALPADSTEAAETIVRVACYGLIGRLDAEVCEFLLRTVKPDLLLVDSGQDARARAMSRWLNVLARFTGAIGKKAAGPAQRLDSTSIVEPTSFQTLRDRQQFVYGRLARAAEVLLGAENRKRGRARRQALELSGEALMSAEISLPEDQLQFVRLLWHTQDLRLVPEPVRFLRRFGYRGLSTVPTLKVREFRPDKAMAKAWRGMSLSGSPR